MDWAVIIQIVMEIVKAIMDKGQKEALEFAADLQAVAIETDDPSRFADVSLRGAFMGLTAHTLSANFGLGAPKLATGAP